MSICTVGWPSEVNTARSVTPRTEASTDLILAAVSVDDLEVVAEQLDRVLALHAGHRLGDVVLQILREVEFDARKFRLQLRQHLVGQTFLVDLRRHSLSRLERREELGVEEAGGVGAVVRPAVLRDDRFHLREAGDQSGASD